MIAGKVVLSSDRGDVVEVVVTRVVELDLSLPGEDLLDSSILPEVLDCLSETGREGVGFDLVGSGHDDFEVLLVGRVAEGDAHGRETFEEDSAYKGEGEEKGERRERKGGGKGEQRCSTRGRRFESRETQRARGNS